MAKLKPILFNTEMVQKIMAGKKTETRRVVLPQPEGARFVLDCDEENRTFDLMCGNNGAGGIFRDWAETVKPKFWFGDSALYQRDMACPVCAPLRGGCKDRVPSRWPARKNPVPRRMLRLGIQRGV